MRDDPGDPLATTRALGYSAGDVVSTGTVTGVAGFTEDAASLYLKPGDLIEAEIEGIGVLRNPGLVAEARGAGAAVRSRRASPDTRDMPLGRSWRTVAAGTGRATTRSSTASAR